MQDSRTTEVLDRIRAARANLVYAQEGRMAVDLALGSAVTLLTAALEWAGE